MMASANLSTPLALFLAQNPGGDKFPERGVDYFDRFKRLDEWLNAKIHVHVNQGATASGAFGTNGTDDAQIAEPPWLTDHGPEHITTVMHRASELTCDPTHLLSPYEAYLLLLAIHFHDVGNVFGRDEHEKKITEVMSQIDLSLLGDNSVEKRMIRDVAMVHGGNVNGDKDTLSHLKYERFNRHDEPRVHFLAALLRFADELAEDCSRTSRFLIDNQLITPGSEVYHIYADRLRRVVIRPQEQAVSLHFELNAATGTRTYQKGNGQVYLFDEIQNRLLKMHKELVYCGRYLRPYVHIESIDVKVEICNDDYFKVLDTMSFSVRESGYPGTPVTLVDVCPELQGQTGQSLQQRIEVLLGQPS